MIIYFGDLFHVCDPFKVATLLSQILFTSLCYSHIIDKFQKTAYHYHARESLFTNSFHNQFQISLTNTTWYLTSMNDFIEETYESE